MMGNDGPVEKDVYLDIDTGQWVFYVRFDNADGYTSHLDGDTRYATESAAHAAMQRFIVYAMLNDDPCGWYWQDDEPTPSSGATRGNGSCLCEQHYKRTG